MEEWPVTSVVKTHKIHLLMLPSIWVQFMSPTTITTITSKITHTDHHHNKQNNNEKVGNAADSFKMQTLYR